VSPIPPEVARRLLDETMKTCRLAIEQVNAAIAVHGGAEHVQIQGLIAVVAITPESTAAGIHDSRITTSLPRAAVLAIARQLFDDNGIHRL
jgi:hypothetical protein